MTEQYKLFYPYRVHMLQLVAVALIQPEARQAGTRPCNARTPNRCPQDIDNPATDSVPYTSWLTVKYNGVHCVEDGEYLEELFSRVQKPSFTPRVLVRKSQANMN